MASRGKIEQAPPSNNRYFRIPIEGLDLKIRKNDRILNVVKKETSEFEL